ncbi:MAG: riboflavin kinase, partial [bacterium]|nr:riboflavin kinase [bacterium]
GTVIKGKGLGTKLGFPTANLDPHNEAMPPLGVYATKTRIGGKLFGSVTNVGEVKKRSFKYDRIIEVHIFGFGKNITGKDIEVLFFKRLRPEMKFLSLNALSAQIEKDCKKARNILRAL